MLGSTYEAQVLIFPFQQLLQFDEGQLAATEGVENLSANIYATVRSLRRPFR